MKINFGGKDRGFQWGIGCIRRYCELVGGDIETMELLDSPDVLIKLDANVKLLLASMTTHCRLNDEVIDFDYDNVEAWLSEAPQKDMDLLMADFLASKFLGKSIQDYFSDSQPDEDNANGSVKKKLA